MSLFDRWFVSRRPMLRSFHLAGSVLEMGCSLPQAVDLTSRLAETRHVSSAWSHALSYLSDGDTLSAVMGRPHGYFPKAAAAFIEAGERQGNVAQALLTLAGNERLDVFRAGYRPRAHNEIAMLRPILGPIPRIARSVVKTAQDLGAETLRVRGRVSLTAGEFLANWPSYAASAATEQPEVGTVWDCSAGERRASGVARDAVSPDGASAEAVAATLDVSDLARYGAGVAEVAVCVRSEWREVMRLPLYVFPNLARSFLFAAGIPYWAQTADRKPAWLGGDAGTTPISIRYEPGVEWSSVFVELAPA